MENQHRKIKGYHELSQDDIDLINKIKNEGTHLESLLSLLRASYDIDQRWISIAETQLQQGIMSAVRAVAKPTSF